MTMTLDDSVVAMWQIELRLRGADDDVVSEGNWVAILSKGEKGFLLNFRYRWYRDEVIGTESKDKRTFYTATMPPAITDPLEAVRLAREVYEYTRDKAESFDSWELIRGERTMEEFTELLATMPGMHMKKVSLKEAKEMGLEE